MTDHELDFLARELEDVLSDTVPSRVLQQARGAFAWRSVASELADLEYDSVLDDDGLARLRAAGGERLLRFRSGETLVEVSVLDEGHRLVVQVSPANYRSVELRHTAGRLHPDLDEAGRFILEDPPQGSMSLRYLPAKEHALALETDWVTI